MAGKLLVKNYRAPAHAFARCYTAAGVALLAEVDRAMGTLSGLATACLLRRQRDVFGDARFARLDSISVAHLYNLRSSAGYRAQRVVLTKTRGNKAVSIGVRKAPAPEGRPSFIRIDSVHQGDWDGIKGVYHINAVDCVTQWQVVASVQTIAENHLLPVIEQMLDKLHVEFTHSRPRRSNDNGLAKIKNGAVVRKMFGYEHISPPASRTALQHLLRAIPQPVSEFSPAMSVCHRGGRCQDVRTHQTHLPSQRCDDAAGQARQPARGGPAPAPGRDA